MIGVNPESTRDRVAATVAELAELGFTATYVYAVGIDEPERVVDVIARAAASVGRDERLPAVPVGRFAASAERDVNSSAVTCPSGRRCNSRKVV